jgi:outer membrane protein assembly factor BamE (lipoprotein component of BamABCDE complex)
MQVTQVQPGWQIKEYKNKAGKLISAKKSFGMNLAQVQKAIGNPLQQKWVQGTLHHYSDMSGRTEAEIISTPGGDIAQFINALNVYMDMTNIPVSNTDCHSLLQQYLKKTTKASFYYPTDDRAIDSIAQAMETSTLDLTQTPIGDNKDQIIKLLTDPLYQGSSMLRIMLQRPEAFHLRSAQSSSLAACAVRAFFELLWDKDDPVSNKMRLVALEGDSAERAVVRVFSNLPCEAQGILPIIAPKSKKVCDNSGCNKQLFLVHPQAPAIMHDEMANFFASQSEHVQASRMLQILKLHSDAYEISAIASVLHPTENIQLPVYNVHLE